MTGSPATEGRRHIVEVRDIRDLAALCPAEAILHHFPEGHVRGELYPAAMLDEGEYILRLNAESWPVLLKSSPSHPPPAMVIESDLDPPIDDTSGS